MATATNASASIIYSGLLDETLSVASDAASVRAASKKPVLKNTTGHSAGFSIGVSHASYARDRFGGVELYGNGVANFLLKSNFAKHLSSGAKISGAAGFVGGTHDVFFRSLSNHGYHQTRGWAKTGATHGFVGFEIESVNGHAKDYGWMKLQFSLNGSSYPDEVTIISWAYQNDGVAIAAGDTGIAPEPSTMALAILAAGAVGVAALRRRRQPRL